MDFVEFLHKELRKSVWQSRKDGNINDGLDNFIKLHGSKIFINIVSDYCANHGAINAIREKRIIMLYAKKYHITDYEIGRILYLRLGDEAIKLFASGTNFSILPIVLVIVAIVLSFMTGFCVSHLWS